MKPNWFIGWPVSLPPGWLHSLEPPPRMRVLHPDDLHATVAFLGDVSEAAARRAWGALPDCLEGPHVATWGDIVPMGPPRRYSALSAELETPAGVLRSQVAMLQPPLLDAAGARPARYPPRPHVTIARPQRRASEAARAEGLQWAAGLSVPESVAVVDRIALYTWSDDRRQRLFRVVAERPLGASR